MVQSIWSTNDKPEFD